MFTNAITTLAIALATLLTPAASAPLHSRDVFVPPVTYPHAGTVWTVGARHNVTWNTANPPAQITNTKGMVVLAKAGTLLDLDDPLAQGFNILDGRVEITVPSVADGSDYTIVLFGDSGNDSPAFTIKN